MKIKIKENSGLAKIAAKNLGANNVAMVIGSTIYLYGVTKENFLKREAWLNHELKHVEQYLRYGIFYFLLLYVVETIRKGYHNNKFEVEARQSEVSNSLLKRYLQ